MPYLINKDDPNDLPYGWEARVDKSSGKIYFLDHVNKTTTWNDPRNLPDGWEMKKDNYDRLYFVNHKTKKTQWDDPRPKIYIPTQHVRKIEKTLSTSTNAKDRQKLVKDEDGKETSHIRGHSLDLEWYADVLKMSLMNKCLDSEEEAYLIKVRDKLDITMPEHKSVLLEIGWSYSEYEEAKKDSEKTKECVVCLATSYIYCIKLYACKFMW